MVKYLENYFNSLKDGLASSSSALESDLSLQEW